MRLDVPDVFAAHVASDQAGQRSWNTENVENESEKFIKMKVFEAR